MLYESYKYNTCSDQILALDNVYIANKRLNLFYGMLHTLTEVDTKSKRKRLKRYKLTLKSF